MNQTGSVSMNRVLAGARLHLISWQTLITPFTVMFSALVINLMIFGLLRARGVGPDEAAFTGGLISLYVTVAIVFTQAVNGRLTFALGLSLTRRSYLLGTALFALGLSLVSAVALYLLRLLEKATDGWWMNLDFFGIGGWETGDPVTQILGYAAPMLALSAIGALIGAIYARWGTVGTYVALVLTALLAGVFVVVVTYAEAWTAVGNWFADQPMAALLAGYPWIIAAVFGACTYLVARRANA